MSRPSAGLLATASLLVVLVRPAAPQEVTVGPAFVLASYREVGAGLQYQGVGYGGAIWGRWRRWRAEGIVTRLKLTPTASAAAGLASFTATQEDGWLSYDIAPYASLEAGVIHRSASPEFGAQSLGAVRVGGRVFSGLGPAATLAFRADYLAAPQFSGGGHAALSLDFGLDLEVRLASRLQATAAYAFQHIDRKTRPGGTPETDSPIQESVARLGLAVRF